MANIGYARCSTLAQDLTAQRQALAALGVPADRIYLDKGLTGTSRARPGLDQALAAVREGDTLTVTKLDRLARSVPRRAGHPQPPVATGASGSRSAARRTTGTTRSPGCSCRSSPSSPSSRPT